MNKGHGYRYRSVIRQSGFFLDYWQKTRIKLGKTEKGRERPKYSQNNDIENRIASLIIPDTAAQLISRRPMRHDATAGDGAGQGFDHFGNGIHG